MFRNWLRDDFSFRCVYCLRREAWATLVLDWQIDHFIPKSLYPAGALDYDNLVLACSSCNHSKATHLAPDPCQIAYGESLCVDKNGEIHALDENGINIIEAMGLDGDDYKNLRQAILELRDALPVGTKVHCRWFGYPKDLPDLSKEPKPPGGNKRPNGISESFFEQRKRGTLAEYY